MLGARLRGRPAPADAPRTRLRRGAGARRRDRERARGVASTTSPTRPSAGSSIATRRSSSSSSTASSGPTTSPRMGPDAPASDEVAGRLERPHRARRDRADRDPRPRRTGAPQRRAGDRRDRCRGTAGTAPPEPVNRWPRSWNPSPNRGGRDLPNPSGWCRSSSRSTTATGDVIAVVALWRDAADLMARLDATRRDIMLMTLTAAVILAGILFLVFRAAQAQAHPSAPAAHRGDAQRRADRDAEPRGGRGTPRRRVGARGRRRRRRRRARGRRHSGSSTTRTGTPPPTRSC